MKLLSILLFLIIAVAILFLAILIAPDQTENLYFWITIGWLIVLAALNWIASMAIFIGSSVSNTKSNKFGILPSLNISIFIYSVFSGALLLSTWYVSDFGILPNWHLILQIILFTGISTLSVLMFISAKAAQVNDVNVPLNKEDLIRILQLINSSKDFDDDKKNLIKELIETIRYSIPHLSVLKSKENYEKLSSLYKNIDENNYNSISSSEIEKSLYWAKNC